MLIRGQTQPSGIVSGSCALSSVHGQPVLPGDGGRSCDNVGQRIVQCRTGELMFSDWELPNCPISGIRRFEECEPTFYLAAKHRVPLWSGTAVVIPAGGSSLKRIALATLAVYFVCTSTAGRRGGSNRFRVPKAL